MGRIRQRVEALERRPVGQAEPMAPDTAFAEALARVYGGPVEPNMARDDMGDFYRRIEMVYGGQEVNE